MPGRVVRTIATVAAFIIGTAPGGRTASIEATALVLLRSVHAGVPAEGIGTVVAADADGTLVVLTAGSLFRREDGEPAADPVDVTAGTARATVLADGILRPIGLSGIALLRVKGLGRPSASVRIDFAAPEVGQPFTIAGLANGLAAELPQRIQFASTRLVSGDRTLSELPVCIGAPAVSAERVFGIVTGCERGRTPVVTLLSTERSYLARHLPPQRTSTAAMPPTTPIRPHAE